MALSSEKRATEEFEYHETTATVGLGSGPGAPPSGALEAAEPEPPPRELGSGWVCYERVQIGKLLVFRWRRPCSQTTK